MKKLQDLEVVILYVSKVKCSRGVDCYLFKNNLGHQTLSIPIETLDIPSSGTKEYRETAQYVANQIKDIIKSFSDDIRKIGGKTAKLVFNTAETSISMAMEAYDNDLEFLDANQTVPFNAKDLDFFFDVALTMKI